MTLKLVLFDLDGTLVNYEHGDFQSSWDAVGKAAHADNPQKFKEWMERVEHYYPRPELYSEWFEQNCSSLEGILTEKVFEKIFPPPYSTGTKQFCQYLQGKNVKTGIVSSGVGFVADQVKKELKMDFYLANEVHIVNGKFTGTSKMNVPLWEKGEVVRKVISYLDLDKEKVAFFGDNKNDLPAWQEVGLPIGINLKSAEYDQHVKQKFADFQQALTYFQKHFK